MQKSSRPQFRPSDFFTRWSLLGGVLLAVLLVALLVALLWLARPRDSGALALTTPDVTVIPAPTLTQPAATPTPVMLVSPTPAPQLNATEIVVGGYVQISGTEGSGLRLRESAGTGAKQLFLGMDNEVFQVRDGPREADGYTWWYLEAPYDKNRAGWAASAFLKVINAPQATP